VKIEEKEKAKMPKFDVTKINVAIDKLLEVTENPDIGFFSNHIAATVTWR